MLDARFHSIRPTLPSRADTLRIPGPPRPAPEREIEFTSIYKQIATFCKSRLSVEYPLTQEAAGKCFSGVSADDAIKKVRALAAEVINANYAASSQPSERLLVLAPHRVLEITLEAERSLALHRGVNCDLPSHPEKKTDGGTLRVP